MSFITNTDERVLADCASLDPLYADGMFIEGVVNLGTTFATPFFRWVPTGYCNGRVTFEKSPVLNLIRPIASLDPGDPLAALLLGQKPPRQTDVQFRH
jgi:hypothetical protein